MIAEAFFWASVGLLPSSDGRVPTVRQGSAAWFSFTHVNNWHAWGWSEACSPSFSDPRDDVMAALNEVMFRTGVYTAQKYTEKHLRPLIEDLPISYNVTGILLSPVNVFESNFSYFAGAATVQIFSILTILFTFYGWWRLGRDVSFSPVELAKVR